MIEFVKVSKDVKTPEKDPDDAGYDLRADTAVTLNPGQRVIVPTGIKAHMPKGSYGRIAPRSGLAVKKGIDVLAGVVDRSYSDEIGVVLINLGQEVVTFNRHDRIAQLVITPYVSGDWVEVSELKKTTRGEKGFGSSGVK